MTRPFALKILAPKTTGGRAGMIAGGVGAVVLGLVLLDLAATVITLAVGAAVLRK